MGGKSALLLAGSHKSRPLGPGEHSEGPDSEKAGWDGEEEIQSSCNRLESKGIAFLQGLL